MSDKEAYLQRVLSFVGLTGKEDINDVSPEQLGTAMALMTSHEISMDSLKVLSDEEVKEYMEQ